MRTSFKPGLVLSLGAAFLISACAADMPKPPQSAVSRQMPPAQTPARVQPATARTPSRPSMPGIIAGTLRDFEVNVGDHVLFAFDKSNLDDSARATLQKQAAWLSRYPAVTVAVQGNADERGTREYNLALGARRANAVKEYLASLGVRNDRLTTISFGKERPICVESNETCWSQNRRAVSAVTNVVPPSSNVAMRN
jgi:peptidoglycan-associated lipoprotein